MPVPSWRDAERWQALLDGSACPFCNGAGPAGVVAELSASVVTVNPDVHVRGYCCVIPREHAAELHTLSAAAALAFMRDVRRAARAVQSMTGAIKLNYEIHGNVVPHVHLHIIPRYPGDDIERTGAGFAQLAASPYAPGEFDAFTAGIRGLLS
jgi:diadenosine tetraphosphate (Ap4A) HIT family hydrolase